MITGIAIENFKGIRDRVEVELRPITLFFGPNSAGKSTVLHALHYAREIFERHNVNADRTLSGGKYVDLGGFRTFVHGQDTSRTVRMSFAVDLEHRYEEYLQPLEAVHRFLDFKYWTICSFDCFATFADAELTVTSAWSDFHHRAYVSGYTVHSGGDVFAEIRSDADGHRVTLNLNAEHPGMLSLRSWDPGDLDPDEYPRRVDDYFEDPERSCFAECLPAFKRLCETADDGAILLAGLNDALPDPNRDLPIALRAMEEFQPDDCFEDFATARRFALDMIDALSRLILFPLQDVSTFVTRLRYLGPLRETPARNYQPPRFADPSRWSSGLGAWDALQNGTEAFVQSVGSWLGDDDKLNSGYRVERRSFKEVDVTDPLIVSLLTGRAFDEADSKSRYSLEGIPTLSRIVVIPQGTDLELRPHDVGVGISQVVPVVATALEGEGHLLAIEQPELHLHPKLQAELGDLFIEVALGDQHQLVVLETHSEHLLLRILRRIRETTDGELPSGKRPVKPDDVAVYFIEGTPDGVVATPLRIDETGDFIDRWPRGFFEERAKELF